MIPKILHQIWIGPDEIPQDHIDTWKNKHPDWIHMLWDEKTIRDEFPNGLFNQSEFDGINEWCGKADVLRYEILYYFGGIFIDADSICLNKFFTSFSFEASHS